MSKDRIRLRLPDGRVEERPAGTTPGEVAACIGPRLAKAALAAQFNGQVVELNRPLQEDGELRILTFEDEEGRAVFRHTSTHIMAQAVKRLYPETRLGTGPALDEGFYYDMDVPVALGPDDFARIEEEMARIVEADYPIERRVLERSEAERLFKERGEDFKVELIQDLPPGVPISVYSQGEFTDLCRGPHLTSTGKVKAFKLTQLSGAYWRADERNPMLQRLYGTSFPRRKELEHYLWAREEAKKRDHRRLGPELDLFSFHDVAPGFVFWHPKGQRLYRELEAFSRELQEPDYQEVSTPPILRTDLWERSGHWEHYRENIFRVEQNDERLGVKPMNCPAHALLFSSRPRSYRELPLRLAEYGPLARFERSGTLHGLVRVRGFHQDDAHLFVTEEQIEPEIGKVLALIEKVYDTFGMDFRIKLSTRPEDFMGELELWEKAEAALQRLMEGTGREYRLNPGDGAFYGPKLDFDVTDSLGRTWQCATIQLDFQTPVRFDLKYTDSDGRERRPVMIHRAVFGSLERFIGILTEHFAGAFPVWLAPVQIRLLPIGERHREYARGLMERFRAAGLRVELDDRNEKIGYKIRQGQLEKIPYMLVVGDREADSGAVAVRSRANGDEGVMPAAGFLERVREEVAVRRR